MLRRRKRASPTDLYKSCLQGGDCIPDVKNKFEGNTVADWLLKIFGGLVYFGNLGIGTGRGTGGSFGYRPFGAPGSGRPIQELPITRPNVVVDPLGPAPIVPIDPSAASVVPLAEGVPDVAFAAPDAGPAAGGTDIELFTITDPATDIGAVGGGPTVTSNEEFEVAVIDAHPIPPYPKQILYDSTVAATIETQINPFLNPDINNVNVIVDPSFAGDTVGDYFYEEIPLERLDIQSFDIEEPPTESTPTQLGNRFVSRTRDLYSRFVAQQPISEPDFLSQPSRLVQFEYRNPAFDPDVSLYFERDVEALRAAPNQEFADVVYLGRPRLSSTSEGTIRVSRLGTRAALTTRSGLSVGPQVHFYMDLSEIPAADSIELQTLNETPQVSTVVDDILATTSFDDPANTLHTEFTEEALTEDMQQDFVDSHLVIPATDEENDTTINIINFRNIPIGFGIDAGDVATVLPGYNILDTSLLVPSTIPQQSVYVLDYADFDLHPGLLPKRRRLDYF
uniref:Minor capsid protein L2 n=1 Tax=Human papillomavirus TaxID=10566 RepID=A0A385PIH7_9PAPI|nr:MAG: L2 protein [Human papillomavirus]